MKEGKQLQSMYYVYFLFLLLLFLMQGGLVGRLPDMRLDGAQDHDRRGRVIPDIAVDQYLATLADWFGLDAQDMIQVFPNLLNFSPDGSSEAALLELFA